MFSLLQVSFLAELFASDWGLLGGFELKDPGAMFGLVAGVERFVVGRTGLPHLPEDFEPMLPEAAQGAGVALAFGTMGAVVGLSPRASLAAASVLLSYVPDSIFFCPQMAQISTDFRARPPLVCWQLDCALETLDCLDQSNWPAWCDA